MKLEKSETYRNEIKSDIVRAGRTTTEVVDSLSDEYGWSRSVPNLSGRLKRGSLRSGEAAELADALDCDLAWQKRGQS
ncbi:LLM class flavin-dependent oxidoreductase [Intestinimonas massiliensis]|uniref:LLM class flavin-dependent oxidoreductase n=1 Tax=Intestinimonas massiliensis (ex Afouda et al. 2020) TaxID=1673721 RepID=A0AAW5JSE8_9FIRM|nr:LLM class flavin-dependent oxidoreductase [Intestinimonas massiliensis (ex Afouda et al. 2020)]MCQ4771855.1 LLM class flavin-dependent oxidoreductase [Intestinimonas massiliensis (ex Afouda et al. 2020)]